MKEIFSPKAKDIQNNKSKYQAKKNKNTKRAYSIRKIRKIEKIHRKKYSNHALLNINKISIKGN